MTSIQVNSSTGTARGLLDQRGSPVPGRRRAPVNVTPVWDSLPVTTPSRHKADLATFGSKAADPQIMASLRNLAINILDWPELPASPLPCATTPDDPPGHCGQS